MKNKPHKIRELGKKNHITGIGKICTLQAKRLPFLSLTISIVTTQKKRLHFEREVDVLDHD